MQGESLDVLEQDLIREGEVLHFGLSEAGAKTPTPAARYPERLMRMDGAGAA